MFVGSYRWINFIPYSSLSFKYLWNIPPEYAMHVLMFRFAKLYCYSANLVLKRVCVYVFYSLVLIHIKKIDSMSAFTIEYPYINVSVSPWNGLNSLFCHFYLRLVRIQTSYLSSEIKERCVRCSVRKYTRDLISTIANQRNQTKQTKQTNNRSNFMHFSKAFWNKILEQVFFFL